MIRNTLLILCCLLLLAVPGQAKKSKGNGKGNKHQDQHGSALPPGLQKKVARGGQLPPGWQKKIAKGKVVDDTVFEYLEVVPPQILKLLPPPPPGVSYRKIQEKIIKLNDITRRILDVLEVDKLPLPKKLPILLPPLP